MYVIGVALFSFGVGVIRRIETIGKEREKC